MDNKYNQYYKHQKSEDHLAKNPEDENKQGVDDTSANLEDAAQQSNDVLNVDDTQQIPEDNIEPPAEPIEGYVTDCIKLNIRKEPSLQADILCEVPVASKLAIDVEHSNDEWFSVVTESGVNGFCMAKYVNVK